MKYKKIGIFYKINSQDAYLYTLKLVDALSAMKCETVVQKDGQGFRFEPGNSGINPATILKGVRKYTQAKLPGHCDAAFVLGGDGTFLNAARMVVASDKNIPIVGVNMGSLGFLTCMTRDEMIPSLKQVLSGKLPVEERMLLDVALFRNGKTIKKFRVLNDAVVNKSAIARMVDLRVFSDDTFVYDVKSDGIIVSTPTGSTAYSLSAGGPIVQPESECLIISPICPHSLNQRPVICKQESRVTIECAKGSDITLTLDGQEVVDIQPGDRIVLKKARKLLHVITPRDRDFFTVLRNKLKLGHREV